MICYSILLQYRPVHLSSPALPSILAGLDSGCPSLLLATLPGGITLQVTASEVRCIPPPPPPLSAAAAAGSPLPLPPQLWRVPPAVPTGGGPSLPNSSSASSLSLAVAKGSWVVVVAGGRRLFVLQVDPASGALTQRYTGEASHSQLSSLALLQIPTLLGQPHPQHCEHPGTPYLEPEGDEEGEEEKGVVREEELYVAVGEWSESRLLLLSLSELLLLGAGGGSGASGGAGATIAPVMLALELPGETPRSAAVLPAGSDKSEHPLLLVGTNGGMVLVWELQPAVEGAAAPAPAVSSLSSRQWQARPGLPSRVRISSVAVELAFHRRSGGGEHSGGGCVYAHSGSDAIFRRRRQRQDCSFSREAGLAEGCLDVCRVHGGSGLRAVCPISTATMLPGR